VKVKEDMNIVIKNFTKGTSAQILSSTSMHVKSTHMNKTRTHHKYIIICQTQTV